VAANIATLAAGNRAALKLGQQRLEDRVDVFPADLAARRALAAVDAALGAG
jgi:hypothetical protein